MIKNAIIFKMRMLTASECRDAMGFPADYKLPAQHRESRLMQARGLKQGPYAQGRCAGGSRLMQARGLKHSRWRVF